jgi:hypothetical protein
LTLYSNTLSFGHSAFRALCALSAFTILTRDMADAQEDIGGQAAADAFSEYVLKAGGLLLGCDAEELEGFCGETSPRSAIDTFAKSEDSTFILEMQSPIKSKSGDDEKKQQSPVIATSFAVFSELPPSVFDNQSSDIKYRMFH